jgi:hypothetical protein
MASSINASLTAGIVQTADTSGNLNLQSGGTTIVAITSSGAAVTGTLSSTSGTTIQGLTVGKGGGAVATNTAVGVSALTANTSGSANTALGFQAGFGNTTGASNVAVGLQAATGTTTGSYNTAIGGPDAATYAVMNNNSTGSYNTAVGTAALAKNTTASANTAVGYQAGYNITTGQYNVILGGSGSNLSLTTGSYGLYVGYMARASGVSANYEMVITSDNTASTGKGASTGFMNPGGGGMYQHNNSASWSTTSDQRLKKNIVDNNEGLAIITAIQVRNFEYRLPEEVDAELAATDAVLKTGVQLGVIAQEFQQVLPDSVMQESTGVLSVDPDKLTWYLVNSIKELKAIVDNQADQIKALQGVI